LLKETTGPFDLDRASTVTDN